MGPDPFPSTTLLFYLWKRPDPSEPGTAPPGLRFPGYEATGFQKAGRQSRCRQQPLFWSNFFSGQNGVLQQGRTYKQVCGRAARAQGHPQGAPLRGDRSLRQGRTYKRTDPFPSTTLPFYLWLCSDPREPSAAPPGLRFSQSEADGLPNVDRRIFCRRQQCLFWSVFSLARMNSCNSAQTERAPSRGAPTVRFVLQQGRTCTGRSIRFRQ